MKKYLIIKADYNDGDYVTKKTPITDEVLEFIRPVIAAVKANKGDYSTYECGDSAEENYGDLEGFKKFNDFVPSGEYGVHTIESIDLLEIIKEESLL